MGESLVAPGSLNRPRRLRALLANGFSEAPVSSCIPAAAGRVAEREAAWTTTSMR